MTRFRVTIARRGHLKIVRFRGHRVQFATIGIAALHQGWVVIDAVAIGRGKRRTDSATVNRPGPQPQRSHAATASVIPHRLPVRLIPDPDDIRRFRRDLVRRQEVRTAANLPPLDPDAEIEQFIRVRIAAEYRKRLEPHVAAILAATHASGGMYATMVRHHKAQREAQLRLFEGDGLVPPDGPFGSSDRT